MDSGRVDTLREFLATLDRYRGGSGKLSDLKRAIGVLELESDVLEIPMTRFRAVVEAVNEALENGSDRKIERENVPLAVVGVRQVVLTRLGELGAGPGVCCEAFDAKLSVAGEKGYSVIATRRWGRPSFYLVTRSVDPEHKVAIEAGRRARIADAGCAEPSIAWAIEIDMPLLFCPYCGADLRAWIEAHPETFERLSIADSS